MTNDINTKIFDTSQEEIEKQLFGGNIYASSHKFPSIYVTSEKIEDNNYYNKGSFITYLSLINDISTTCGGDLAKLFGEIYKIYNINDDPIHHSIADKMIIDFCKEAMANLALAMNQSEILKKKIEEHFNKINNKNYEINGKDYCFIVIVLNNLFYYYSTVVNFIFQKRYTGPELVDGISSRILLIVSEEFDLLRRIFKVIECYKEAHTNSTFH